MLKVVATSLSALRRIRRLNIDENREVHLSMRLNNNVYSYYLDHWLFLLVHLDQKYGLGMKGPPILSTISMDSVG